MSSQQSSDKDSRRDDVDNPVASPKEMDRQISYAPASTDNTGTRPKETDRQLSHAPASTDNTGTRPKEMDRQASSAQDADTDQITYCNDVETLSVSEKGNASSNEYAKCTKNKDHTNMKMIRRLKARDLPSGYRTDENYKQVIELSKRVVRVYVPSSCGEKPNVGTGFLYPGMFHEKEPCPCKECKDSGKAVIGYHSVYVLTARHVVDNERDAQISEFDLFYNDYYRTGVQTLHGIGMAGDEKCIRYDENGNGEFRFVAHDDSETKDQSGDSDTKDQSGDSDTKDQSGDSDTKDQSGDSDTKDQSGDSDTKDQSGDSDTKDQSGDSDTKDQSGDSDTKDQSGDSDTKDQSGDSDTKGQSDDNDTKDQSGDSDTKGQSGDNDAKGQSGDSDTKGQSGDSDTKGQRGDSDTNGQSGDSDTKGQSGDSDTKGHIGDSDTKGHIGDSDTKGQSGDCYTMGQSGDSDTKGQSDDSDTKGQSGQHDDGVHYNAADGKSLPRVEQLAEQGSMEQAAGSTQEEHEQNGFENMMECVGKEGLVSIGIFDDTIDPRLISFCKLAVSLIKSVPIHFSILVERLKEVIETASVEVVNSDPSDDNAFVSLSSLATFVDVVYKGEIKEALSLAEERLILNNANRVFDDQVFNKIKESTTWFHDQEYQQLLSHIGGVMRHLVTLGAMVKYFLKNEILHKTILELRSILDVTTYIIGNIGRVLERLSLGDVETFIGFGKRISAAPDNDFIVDENAGDSNIQALHLNCDGMNVDNIDTMCKLLSHVLTLYCQCLREFNQKDCHVYLNILAPLFVDESCIEKSGLMVFFQIFGDFLNKISPSFRDIHDAFTSMTFNVVSIIDTISTSCLIDTSSSNFMAGYYTELFDHLNFYNNERKTDNIDGDFERYKTDKVLVKCVTHEKTLIDDYLKKMDFFPPCLPFTCIISHPHGYVKHIAFGEMSRASTHERQRYYTVTLTTEAKFRLVKQSTASEDVARFMRFLKFGEIKESEIYNLPCQLTLAFQTKGVGHPVFDCSGWMKFPANTARVIDKLTFETFVLPENIEFYSPVSIASALSIEDPYCFTHSVPTCKGSSGALIHFPIAGKLYLVHSGSATQNGEVLGLTSITDNIDLGDRSKLFSLRDILKVTTTSFLGAGPFEHYSGQPFK